MSNRKPIICPTVTADEPHAFREQMERVAPLTHRIHVDLADGVFTDNQLLGMDQVWWPAGIKADMHLMYEAVAPFMKQILSHKPHMVIVHAEAVGNFYTTARRLKKFDIKVGVAVLQHTKISKIKPALPDIDHVLIFSGNLGHFGGKVDLDLLDKVTEIRKYNKAVEIGWDGGITLENAAQLVAGGIDVLNVGGALQRAADPQATYAKLISIIEGV